MDNWLQISVTAFFGAAAFFLGAWTLRLKIKDHKRDNEKVLGHDRRAALFLDRNAMIKSLAEMYSNAKEGDEIWGQCVGCGDYTQDLEKLVLRAASKGVSHRLIVNKYAPTVSEFRAIFDPLATADVAEGVDNKIRIQGLSAKEVIVSIPEMNSYTGILIRDPGVVQIFYEWFDNRFGSIKAVANALPIASAPENPKG